MNELARRLNEIPRDKEIVAYCRGPYCLMARDAVLLLKQQGFEAIHLPEGVAEWGMAPVR
jgi:rhodanese-related sulfurtransferase